MIVVIIWGACIIVVSIFFSIIPIYEGTLLGTPNREAQENSRNGIGIYLQGSSYSIIFLQYSWGPSASI